MTLQTELGQLLDLTSQPMDGKIDLNRFTVERYRLIVKYKTAFYTFYLPIVRPSQPPCVLCLCVSPDRINRRGAVDRTTDQPLSLPICLTLTYSLSL